MFINKLVEGREIRVAIPLTSTSGKARIKQRDMGVQPMFYCVSR